MQDGDAASCKSDRGERRRCMRKVKWRRPGTDVMMGLGLTEEISRCRRVTCDKPQREEAD